MLESKYKIGNTLTLGILGGGQLAKMLALEAYKMGLEVAIIENHKNSPAGDMTKFEFTKGWEDRDELDRFIEVSDVITLENEFIDPAILSYIAEKREVYPSAETMKLVRDKFIQKQTFQNAGIDVAEFTNLESEEEVADFGRKFGYPFVIKSRKFGYDGYGNSTVFNEKEAIGAFKNFKSQAKRSELMAEKFVDFKKELAVMVARNKSGETAIYPCVETIQYRHICHAVIAPAEINPDLQKKAQQLALKCVESINGIGVFGIELFLTKDDKIYVNEIAPRPHNSGHYTIEACHTSQFENAIRAVANLPLGHTKMVSAAAVMVNLLGARDGKGVPENVIELLNHKGAILHLYNKKSSRVGRKMGHVTVLADTQDEARNRAYSAAEAIVW